MEPILIAGAGPGGLALAVALTRVGRACVVLERAPELRTAGAGLSLQANATRALRELGVFDAVAAAAAELEGGRICTAHGEALGAMDFAPALPRYGVPALGAHRGALSRVLAAALPAGCLRFGAAVNGVGQGQDGVQVRLDSGEVLTGSALVGADGIHSAVRRALFGERPLRRAGQRCWRGIAPVASPEPLLQEWWGQDRRFGYLPIGPEQTYWFAVVGDASLPAQGPGAGNDQGEAPDLAALFADFAEPVPGLIAAAEVILDDDLRDLPQLETWTKGRVTLLGDAAHAMTPNMGQGACQALEDALVLGAALAEHSDPAEAFAAYERARYRRATQVASRSWRLGQLAHVRSAPMRWLRDQSLRWSPASATERSLDQLWGVDLPSLDAAAPAP